jgi:Sep15/SelM redox domain
LFLFDETGKEVDKIDLSRMKTAQLHELMKTKGFTRQSNIPQGSVEMNRIRRTDQERFLRRSVPPVHL